MIDFKRALKIMRSDNTDIICLAVDTVMFLAMEIGSFFIKDFPALEPALIIPGFLVVMSAVSVMFAIVGGIVNRIHNLFSRRRKFIDGLPVAVYTLIIAVTITARYIILTVCF